MKGSLFGLCSKLATRWSSSARLFRSNPSRSPLRSVTVDPCFAYAYSSNDPRGQTASSLALFARQLCNQSLAVPDLALGCKSSHVCFRERLFVADRLDEVGAHRPSIHVEAV